ncbi:MULTISPECIES: hypothetical protein [Brevibacillus]|uniref:hypothetical protein n=1 Tax=Brevibacillus TaxID=55080 RepID=UPI000ACD449F|nr:MULTISPECIES: hypothetical protein [Brevibacillus]
MIVEKPVHLLVPANFLPFYRCCSGGRSEFPVYASAYALQGVALSAAEKMAGALQT